MIHRKLFVGILCASALVHAQAHQIWIESTGKQYSLHFGEYDENLKEVSPGLLDKMPVPAVNSIGAGKSTSITPTKQKDGFALGKIQSDSIVAEVRNYPVIEKKSGEQVTRTKWVPAARYAITLGAQAPVNLLDIVPTSKPERFAVYFRGQPLAKTKVTLVAPNGWQKSLQSDQNGEVEAATLWRGLYVLEVGHKETIAGEINGDAYDIASFTSTLSFSADSGAETPRPAAAKPNPASY
jgi:hypothetical protein